jgi:hypothetical protein
MPECRPSTRPITHDQELPMRSLLLLFLGIPFPIIILKAIFT